LCKGETSYDREEAMEVGENQNCVKEKIAWGFVG
jgi:hypothetical protein